MSVQQIYQYHANVERLIRYGGSRNESALRKCFHDLLQTYATPKNLILVPEVEVRTRAGHRVVPDGTLKDPLRQDWGYWESKDEKDDLDAEIATKLAKGYPTDNILFEDTHTAVLYQNGAEVLRAPFADVAAFDSLLIRFISYEPLEVRGFHRAIKQFNEDVPALAAELRAVIGEQYAENAAFRQALGEFLELCKKAINPRVEMADMREMLIQHILTEDVFMTIFDDPQFHRDNAIARKLQDVLSTFYTGATRRKIRDRIAPYYETVNARAACIANNWEKQKFLKALYETFYRAYNPKAADRLGVIYTPDEIVRFMIHAVDYLLGKHFGVSLGDPNVPVLDPVVGTGTFVTELIEYLPASQVAGKYRGEIFCNEVAILPYYIANLNIEYTYRQKMGEYVPFENICFVDTLDNMGFVGTGEQQMDFLGLVDENVERIQRQNAHTIFVIIGNPPYNANQLNENENNKNREYPEIDRRIKATYVRQSTAQKTKLYDMYARFLRWASDRLGRDGVVAFVSNNSFLDARAYDGFRKVVADEFSHIYVVDLKGNARTSGERRRREGGNVFSNQIRVGVAVYFLVRRHGETGCRIWYNAVPDYVRGEDKKAYLRDNPLAEIKFDPIHPDKDHNWLNHSESYWDELIPVASKETKLGTRLAEQQAIFKLYSLGVVTARDEWAYDLSLSQLRAKVELFYGLFTSEQERWAASDRKTPVNDFVDRGIKWTSELEAHLNKGARLTYSPSFVTTASYRPFVKHYLYYDRVFVHRTYQWPEIFPIGETTENLVICVNVGNRPFNVLAVDRVTDYHLNGDAQCLPLYRYPAGGERVENITDWALAQFRQHYADQRIQKLDIFHYVYAVLHNPAYREKYALNLRREFPRIPFYDDFWQWAGWGSRLLELHLGYEQAEPYPLEREDLDPQTVRRAVVPRLIARKPSGVIEVDTLTTLRGVPPEAWDYRLGTYTALEWVLERYKERTPKDPTIRERFNTYRFADYKEHVIDLLRRVCTVSFETMAIVREMMASVKP